MSGTGREAVGVVAGRKVRGLSSIKIYALMRGTMMNRWEEPGGPGDMGNNAAEMAGLAGQKADREHGAEAQVEMRPPLEWAVINGDDKRISNLDALRGEAGHEDDPITEDEYNNRTMPLAGDWAHKEGRDPSLAERQRMGRGPNPEAESK
jgi:hypothetical protein